MKSSARGVRGIRMAWFWFVFSFLIANAAAVVFYLLLRLGRWPRTAVWVVCFVLIVFSPFCVPREARKLRFLDAVAAVCLLFKVYDAYRQPATALGMGIGRWLAYLHNWFWFVLRRVPRRRPAPRDWARVTV